jgi:cytochrome c553
MARDQGPFRLANPWPRIGWWLAASVIAVSIVLGFIVLPRFQQNGPVLDTWTAICTALGIQADTAPAGEPQPPLQTPTRIAWTPELRDTIVSGDKQRGEFVAINCSACHGDQGVSHSPLIPTLAGMDRAVIYKQLDDYSSRKRLWGVMNGIASALTPQSRADVAAYFASRQRGLLPVTAEVAPAAGRSLRQSNPALRLVFAGDPKRGVPPCSACHGPGGQRLGAPLLTGQQAPYIERQLAEFAQGMRQNDINKQMRTLASGLTADEMHAIAVYYGSTQHREKENQPRIGSDRIRS